MKNSTLIQISFLMLLDYAFFLQYNHTLLSPMLFLFKNKYFVTIYNNFPICFTQCILIIFNNIIQSQN